MRMFEILRKYECQWVAQADLKSMLAGILLSHPGLEFLQVGRPWVCPCSPPGRFVVNKQGINRIASQTLAQ